MTIGLVSGIIVAPHRDPALDGVVLLAVQELDLTLTPTGHQMIVADRVGAGVGDLILITQGGPALQTEATTDRPIDAVAVAIIEKLHLG